MRLLYLGSLLIVLTACGSEPSTNTAAPLPPAPAAAPPTPVELSLDDQLAAIKSEYLLIGQEMEGEVYTADTILYSCDEGMMDGEVLLYSDSEALRVAINSFSLGDHAGKTEYWYFKDGEPFFLLEESGSWQFGGPYREDEDGNPIPGSIDKVEQLRYYIADGKVIRKLRKAFEIKSWEDSPAADQVPNEEVVTTGQLPVGYKAIKLVVKARKMDCEVMAI